MNLKESIELLNNEINEKQDDYEEGLKNDKDIDYQLRRIKFPKGDIQKGIISFMGKKFFGTPDFIEDLSNQFKNYKKPFMKIFIVYFKEKEIGNKKIVYLGNEKEFNSILEHFNKDFDTDEIKEKSFKQLIKDNKISVMSDVLKRQILNGKYYFNKKYNYIVL